MIDFPSSPTVGQIFNSGSGPIYIWDGVAWSLVGPLAGGGWEPIGVFDLAGLSVKDITGLGAFRNLRLNISGIMSSAGQALLRFSSDGGASFYAGASDYQFINLVVQGTSASAFAVTNSTGIPLTGGSDANFVHTTSDITFFNEARLTHVNNDINFVGSSVVNRQFPAGYANNSVVMNALRVSLTAGTFTVGKLILEGVRA